MADGWTRASEVLTDTEWEQLEQLPPSEFADARRRVQGERQASERAPDVGAELGRLTRRTRILRKQATGDFPSLPRGGLSQWAGMLRHVDELLEVARRDKAETQSFRDWYDTRSEALQRAHSLVQTLAELCPTKDELLELRDRGLLR